MSVENPNWPPFLDLTNYNPKKGTSEFYLFAGANLHGKGADSVDAEDGILSTYEVSAMDLHGTDMVVLSACETGLGEVK